ncbi:aminopeptidase P family protein [Pseudorhodoplanes sinuspersici]|uniref:X-Pro aminopeptidase n=1 Tax=Pseudorhodoplanes sinuspersici TaxID=1235591 RepID=A0A1W6ZZE9_9HYPH|nr:aminopeptidase P family protein [Pseudorhodoplanes sinuspersici]ARQ02703.1 X-Pro aminopeptidase [Pseudorhodoplanes sinuspersici]RKE68322.1 Xaa-Pro aminopeptidase [Pseudorhodoplanes sinuspersici]
MFSAKFQTFDDVADPAAAAPRIAALRAKLRQNGLDGFVLPRADRHQNEYVPESEERLAFLTGFTGSAGFLIVLLDKAILFTDGRYTLQAREQTDPAIFSIVNMVETSPAAWIEQNLPAGTTLGYDAWLHTAEGAEKLSKACAKVGATLVPVKNNPVDDIWKGRPAPPLGAVVLHDLRHTGAATKDKLQKTVAEIGKQRADALVITDPHNIAWLFNIRGSDVAHTPLPLSFGLVPKDGRPSIYIDGRKLSNAVRDQLEQTADVREPDSLTSDIEKLGKTNATMLLDQATAADALVKQAEQAGGKIVRVADPITALKAVKNETEIAGAHNAQARDGAAMARFLAWFDREAPRGQLTEIAAVEALETFRRESGALKDVSFPSISGAGPNGAIVHYRVTRKTNRPIKPGELFLIDSGGQYDDGTTDITRTIAVGTPTEEMRTRFTQVLKGHIAVARAIFPDGTSGAQLDTLARQYLWQAGVDFEHGTGHGVGSYLSVHEGPARISKLGTVPLKRGMILSNEPGYYKADGFGIRIENLILVVAAPVIAGAEKPMNAFETITLAPIDRSLIDVRLMTAEEIAWLDSYHARVAETIAPLVDKDTQAWLKAVTRPLGDN